MDVFEMQFKVKSKSKIKNLIDGIRWNLWWRWKQPLGSARRWEILSVTPASPGTWVGFDGRQEDVLAWGKVRWTYWGYITDGRPWIDEKIEALIWDFNALSPASLGVDEDTEMVIRVQDALGQW